VSLITLSVTKDCLAIDVKSNTTCPAVALKTVNGMKVVATASSSVKTVTQTSSVYAETACFNFVAAT